jgi:hypothetical protein
LRDKAGSHLLGLGDAAKPNAVPIGVNLDPEDCARRPWR